MKLVKQPRHTIMGIYVNPITEWFVRRQMASLACGSLRREKPMLGDLDIVVCNDFVGQISLKTYVDGLCSDLWHYAPGFLWCGEKKCAWLTLENFQIEIRFTKGESWGAMIMTATGPKEFNLHMRALAKSKGWRLNEYGLFDEKGTKLAGETEIGILNQLGYDWIPPYNRHMTAQIKPVEVIGSKGVKYNVSYTGTGWTCTCPQFKFRGVECKHIIGVKEKNEQVATATT